MKPGDWLEGRKAFHVSPFLPTEGSYRFRCTGDVESFKALGTRFLQMPHGEVVRVQLREKVAV